MKHGGEFRALVKCGRDGLVVFPAGQIFLILIQLYEGLGLGGYPDFSRYPARMALISSVNAF